MSELRQSCLTGDWTVVATVRAHRPHSFARAVKPAGSASHAACPFCPQNEELTPPELFALRPDGSAPDGPGWLVRVVPNKFPTFAPHNAAPESIDALHPVLPGVGSHEVIIHSPDHEISLGQMDLEEVARIFSVYRSRLRFLADRPDLASAIIIVNHGAEAGASIAHAHSQLFAVPIVPGLLEQELRRFSAHENEHGTCLLCDLVESEKKAGDRLVLETEDFLAFCPFASRVPFEIYVVPKKHSPDFGAEDDRMIEAAAEMMRLALNRILTELGDVPYNLYLHTRPFHLNEPYHWHFAILPKTSIFAGFEFGTGIMINVVEPEAAAEFLRAAGAPHSSRG